jgi:hypothetical protein
LHLARIPKTRKNNAIEFRLLVVSCRSKISPEIWLIAAHYVLTDCVLGLGHIDLQQTRTPRCPAFRRGNYHTGQLRRYKRFRVLGLLFVLPNYISRRPAAARVEKTTVRAAHLLVTGWQSAGWLACMATFKLTQGGESPGPYFFILSPCGARAISLRALFPQRTTFSLLHIQPAGEIFSGYCSSLVFFFSLRRHSIHGKNAFRWNLYRAAIFVTTSTFPLISPAKISSRGRPINHANAKDQQHNNSSDDVGGVKRARSGVSCKMIVNADGKRMVAKGQFFISSS